MVLNILILFFLILGGILACFLKIISNAKEFAQGWNNIN